MHRVPQSKILVKPPHSGLKSRFLIWGFKINFHEKLKKHGIAIRKHHAYPIVMKYCDLLK
jgi:hypothetical protein